MSRCEGFMAIFYRKQDANMSLWFSLETKFSLYWSRASRKKTNISIWTSEVSSPAAFRGLQDMIILGASNYYHLPDFFYKYSYNSLNLPSNLPAHLTEIIFRLVPIRCHSYSYCWHLSCYWYFLLLLIHFLPCNYHSLSQMDISAMTTQHLEIDHYTCFGSFEFSSIHIF